MEPAHANREIVERATFLYDASYAAREARARISDTPRARVPRGRLECVQAAVIPPPPAPRPPPAPETPAPGGAARPPPVAHAAQRPPCPRGLRLPRARGLDRLGDQRLAEPARREIRLDAEPPRPARPERPRALLREGRVADVAELAAAGDGGRRGLAPVAEGDQPRLEPRLGLGRALQEPRRHVERRRGRARPAAARSGRP